MQNANLKSVLCGLEVLPSKDVNELAKTLLVLCILCLVNGPAINLPSSVFFVTEFPDLIPWCDPPPPPSTPSFSRVILVCDPPVDQFLHVEESGSGESDSDFLPSSSLHRGKFPHPDILLFFCAKPVSKSNYF